MERANLDKYYKENIGLIHVVASKGMSRLQAVGSSLTFDDLVQELSAVFVKAYDLFDESQNFKFSTYFTIAARNALNKLVKEVQTERMEHKVRSFEELNVANGDDDDRNILDTIPSDSLTPQDVLERKQAVASLSKRLSPLALTIVKWVIEPPEFLNREYDAYGAHIKYAQSQGAKNRKMEYSPRFVVNVLEKTGQIEPAQLRSALSEINRFVGARND